MPDPLVSGWLSHRPELGCPGQAGSAEASRSHFLQWTSLSPGSSHVACAQTSQPPSPTVTLRVAGEEGGSELQEESWAPVGCSARAEMTPCG
uniref:Uncharacterized protein n=1 Tax=Aquila chrysaetos chrysaetos TaxID=223781 RepID=A0A663EM30_AQUCH